MKLKLLDLQKPMHAFTRVRMMRVLLQSSYIAIKGLSKVLVSILFPWHLLWDAVRGRMPLLLDTSSWCLQSLLFLLIKNLRPEENMHSIPTTMQRFPTAACSPGCYLINGELFPSRLQVPRCGLAEFLITVIFLAAIVIHQRRGFGPTICSS